LADVPAHEVTQLLQAWSGGDEQALGELIPLIHKELHRLARRYMAGESPGHTLQTTALVNEAYLRLVDVKNVNWQNRAHFFGVSAQVMRRILVDFARSRRSLKRGGETFTVSLEEGSIVSRTRGADSTMHSRLWPRQTPEEAGWWSCVSLAGLARRKQPSC
jgi:RNA polymerase sigma factor (TIGR02999 family)